MKSSVDMETSSNLLAQDSPNVKAVKRRWFVLVIFIIFAAVNSFQWVAYSIMTKTIVRYYGVGEETVDITSLIYTGLYAILIFPATYIVSKKGLRTALLLGGLGTAVGTVLKILSTSKDGFWVVLLGQGFLGASQVIICCLPARISAVWFKSDEISLACALGVVGTQLGVGLGFVVPPIIVRNHANVDSIGSDLKILCWGLTGAILPATIAVLFFIPDKPEHEPNITQLFTETSKAESAEEDFLGSLKKLVINKPFMLHLMGYALSDGVTNSFNTLLSQNVLHFFPNCQQDAGRMGMLMIFAGIVTSILVGYILDRTHKYKETTVFIYFFIAVTFAALMFSLESRSKLLVYITVGLIGLFNNSYNVVAIEFAMELTFPSVESTTNGFLIMPSQVGSFIFTILFRKLNIILGPFATLGLQSGILLFGTILTACVPNNLKRQRLFNRAKSQTHNKIQL